MVIATFVTIAETVWAVAKVVFDFVRLGNMFVSQPLFRFHSHFFASSGLTGTGGPKMEQQWAKVAKKIETMLRNDEVVPV